jgi:signal transduction histidine kinase
MRVIRNLRLGVFEVLLLVALGVIGWAAYETFQAIQMVGGSPRTAEYFVIADHLQPSVEELNGALVRYVVRGERADWDRFQLKSHALKEWITRQKSTFAGAKVVQVQPVILTTDLNTLLLNIERALDDYMATAQKAAPAAGPPASQEQKLASLEQVQVQSLRLAALGSQARAEGQTIQLFLSGSKPWFPTFRRLMHVYLLVMTAMLVWLMMVMYRRVVSPLRSKLIESDVIIEGQRKLATYGKHSAGVAHEIRTPLTTIKARLFTLQKRLARGTPEYRDAIVIDNEINRLDRIVTDFLTLGRPALPNLVPVSADALLRDVSELFRPQCEKQSIQLRVDTVVDTPFLADTGQLKQVLINLVRNAAESIGKGGTISLRARRDTWRLNNLLAEVVILEVQDTGHGIPPAVQQRLFDPFFSTKERGTGLGLSLAAAIIGKHGGKLVVRLHPGQGATVGVVLPCHTPTP